MTEPVTIAPGIQRLRAANPSALTGSGTNTYILGGNDLAVIESANIPYLNTSLRSCVCRAVELVHGGVTKLKESRGRQRLR
jgi:hypothetical protein